MKLKNIEKKNTFWYQYKGRIKEAVMEFLKFLLTLVCVVVCYEIFYLIFIHGMVKEFVFTIYILYAIVVFYKTIMFYVHQQYIPLSKEELSKNNITTRTEYDAFLKKYLNNFEPAKKIKEMIYFNTFRYLYTHEQQLKYIEFWKEKGNGWNEEFPEPLELIKKIMNYDLDYDVHKDDGFVSSVVYNTGGFKFNGFYFDYSPINCLNRFAVVSEIFLIVIFILWIFTSVNIF